MLRSTIGVTDLEIRYGSHHRRFGLVNTMVTLVTMLIFAGRSWCPLAQGHFLWPAAALQTAVISHCGKLDTLAT